MKKTLTFVFGLILMIGCTTKNDRQPKYDDFTNDWEQQNLFGKVQTLEISKTVITDTSSNSIDKPVIIKNIAFTDFGKIASLKEFDNSGKLVYTEKNEFDNDENKIKLESEDYLAKTKLTQTSEFNNKGKEISTKMIVNNVAYDIVDMAYDSLGNLTHQTIVHDKNRGDVRNYYKYNEKGKIILKRQSENKPSSELDFVTKSVYDNNERLIMRSIRYGMLGNNKTFYKYDAQNRIRKTIQSSPGKVEKVMIFDPYFNPVLIRVYKDSVPDQDFRYTYRFDEQGNWIERKVSVQDVKSKGMGFVPAYVEKRKIRYY